MSWKFTRTTISFIHKTNIILYSFLWVREIFIFILYTVRFIGKRFNKYFSNSQWYVPWNHHRYDAENKFNTDIPHQWHERITKHKYSLFDLMYSRENAMKTWLQGPNSCYIQLICHIVDDFVKILLICNKINHKWKTFDGYQCCQCWHECAE